MSPLPFSSFHDIHAIHRVDDAAVCVQLRNGEETVLPISDINTAFKNFGQAWTYFEQQRAPVDTRVRFLRSWNNELTMRGPLVFSLYSGASTHAVGVIEEIREKTRKNDGQPDQLILHLRTCFGTSWELPVSHWEAQFPGFTQQLAMCESLDLSPVDTARHLLAWVAHPTEMPDTSPPTVLPPLMD